MSTVTGRAPLGRDHLQPLRDVILENPDAGKRSLATRLATPVEPAHHVDLLILLAETLAWRGRLKAAARVSRDAAQAADVLNGDLRRRTLTVGLAADLALRSSYSDTVDACLAFTHAVAGEAPFHWPRYVVATALHAIAVYRHRDRHAGERTLSQLLNKVEAGTCLSAALAAGHGAMTAQSSYCPEPRSAPTNIPPLPGLLLVPDLSTDVTTVGESDINQAFARRVRLPPSRSARIRSHLFRGGQR
jgi:hypothetical protein